MRGGKRFDIVTFGSGLIDIFVFTELPERKNKMVYEVGSKILVEDVRFDIGGGGVNTGTSFSRMGLSCGFYSRLGNDDFARKILDSVLKEGIKFLGKSDGKTGYSIILDSKEHNRTILTYKGSGDEIEIEDREIKKLNSEWFYFSSLVGKSFKSYEKIVSANKDARVAFNPSLYLLKREKVKGFLKRVNVLILNKEEADLINKRHEKILELGPEIVCVTDGKKPFFCYTAEGNFKVYPNKDVKVVERTGAGDAFAAGFLAAYIRTGDISLSLKIGVANSESVVGHFGARNKILSWDEALNSVKRNGAKVVMEGKWQR